MIQEELGGRENTGCFFELGGDGVEQLVAGRKPGQCQRGALRNLPEKPRLRLESSAHDFTTSHVGGSRLDVAEASLEPGQRAGFAGDRVPFQQFAVSLPEQEFLSTPAPMLPRTSVVDRLAAGGRQGQNVTIL